MQVGCGTGNTTLPLAELNASATIVSCDYAATAVQLLKQAVAFDTARMAAFVADATADSFHQQLPTQFCGRIDVATCIFMLSANDPLGASKVRFQHGTNMPGHDGGVDLNHECCLAMNAVQRLLPTDITRCSHIGRLYTYTQQLTQEAPAAMCTPPGPQGAPPFSRPGHRRFLAPRAAPKGGMVTRAATRGILVPSSG